MSLSSCPNCGMRAPPLQVVLRPAVELLEPALVARGFLAPSAPGRSPWPGNAARAGLVLATGGVAALVPHFGLLTDLFAGAPALWLRARLHDWCAGLRPVWCIAQRVHRSTRRCIK